MVSKNAAEAEAARISNAIDEELKVCFLSLLLIIVEIGLCC